MMTKFIAEIGSNHNGSLNRALALIDKAAEIGCDGVKFQLFRLDKMFAPEVLAHPNYQHLQKRREWELPLEWLPEIAKRCSEKGLLFGCTPFYLEAVGQLKPYVDYFKIASYDLLRNDLLKEVARTGLPVMLSTGMASISEVEAATGTLFDYSVSHLTLLHCISSYPTPISKCNPRFLYELYDIGNKAVSRWNRARGTFDLGWSDHTVNPGVIIYFVIVQRAKVIEFHLDITSPDYGVSFGQEYSGGHCWLPQQIQPVIKICQDVKWMRASGGKEPISNVEFSERGWRADPSDGLRPLLRTREMEL